MDVNIFTSRPLHEVNHMLRNRGRFVVRDGSGAVIGVAVGVSEDSSSSTRWLLLETGLFNSKATIDTRFPKWNNGIVSKISRDDVLFPTGIERRDVSLRRAPDGRIRVDWQYGPVL